MFIVDILSLAIRHEFDFLDHVFHPSNLRSRRNALRQSHAAQQ
jgi:hypothetical protein